MIKFKVIEWSCYNFEIQTELAYKLNEIGVEKVFQVIPHLSHDNFHTYHIIIKEEEDNENR